MRQYDRIIWECFWDMHISEEELKQIIVGDDWRQKKQVFERILLNSSNFLRDLQLFNREELGSLLEEYRLPEFNRDHAFRRKNIAEVFFFEKELEITELQWKR